MPRHCHLIPENRSRVSCSDDTVQKWKRSARYGDL